MYSTKIKVRYCETDQMRVVHHANYYNWFEVGRTEFLEDLGYPYAKLEQEGTMLPVLETHCCYKNSAKYGDELTIIVKLDYLKGIRTSFSYQVVRESDNKQIAEGSTVHTFLDKQFKPVNPSKHCKMFYDILNNVLNK